MPSELVISGVSSLLATGTGGITDIVDFLDLFFVPFLAVVLLVIFFAAFFVVFAAFFAALPLRFLVDFLAALVDFFAPPLDFDLDALFFVPLPPPLRAPLDFLVPFLAAISFAPFVGLSLGSP
jgi:hypothetical protein